MIEVECISEQFDSRTGLPVHHFMFFVYDDAGCELASSRSLTIAHELDDLYKAQRRVYALSGLTVSKAAVRGVETHSERFDRQERNMDNQGRKDAWGVGDETASGGHTPSNEQHSDDGSDHPAPLIKRP
jgi:hypothetical protein